MAFSGQADNVWEVLAFHNSDKASKVMVELLGSYTEENASQARDDAHRFRLVLCCLTLHMTLITWLDAYRKLSISYPWMCHKDANSVIHNARLIRNLVPN